MSGHSKWHTIKRKKGAADAARGKLFNRIIRELTVAARMGGADSESNPRLRSAMANAKANNMPGKNIDNAIAKGTGSLEGVTYEEITFEAYGPGGVAILVDCVTDNRNRTVAEVRHVITKVGGNLGAANSVNWMFKSLGVIRVAKDAADEDKVMEIALEAGADDMQADDDAFEVTCAPGVFEDVRSAIEGAGIEMESAQVTKIPENTVKVEGETAQKVLKLMDALDELDDTQNVSSNLDISEEDIAAYNS